MLNVWWDGDGYSPIETAPEDVKERLKILSEQIKESKRETNMDEKNNEKLEELLKDMDPPTEETELPEDEVIFFPGEEFVKDEE